MSAAMRHSLTTEAWPLFREDAWFAGDLSDPHSWVTGAWTATIGEFPKQQPGLNFLTEGGQETEIMYKYGFDLPQFAMFPLLDNPRAVSELHGMMAGISIPPPGTVSACSWAASTTGEPGLGLAAVLLPGVVGRDANAGNRFLREVARPYQGQVPALIYAGSSVPAGTRTSPLEFMPAIEPGTWFKRVRSLRPNAAMMDKIRCARSGISKRVTRQARRAHGRRGPAIPPHRRAGRLLWHVDTHLDEIARNVRPRVTEATLRPGVRGAVTVHMRHPREESGRLSRTSATPGGSHRRRSTRVAGRRAG